MTIIADSNRPFALLEGNLFRGTIVTKNLVTVPAMVTSDSHRERLFAEGTIRHLRIFGPFSTRQFRGLHLQQQNEKD